MKNTPQKRAPKAYQDADGVLHTACALPLKKEADLALAYYPGVTGVLSKIEAKAANQLKYDRLHKTVALISTLPTTVYPVLAAKAAVLSEVAALNAFPVLLNPDQPTTHAETVARLQRGFSAVLTVGMSRKEVEILRSTWSCDLPLLVDYELEAAAVAAAVMNAAKMSKSSLKKIRVVLDGEDDLTLSVAEQLVASGVIELTLIDERGPLFLKRPNMNRQKNDLAEVTKKKKDERSLEEVYSATDVYIHCRAEDLSEKTCEQLPAKATVITLKAEEVKCGKQQSLISTLPQKPNHLSDLHLASGILMALGEGKSLGKTTLDQAIKALHAVYKSPKKDRLFPGLLDKNLAEKIAKGIK